MRPLTKFAIGMTVLVIGASALKALVSPGPQPRHCVVACASPPTGTVTPSGQTFVSPRYGFSFGYPSGGRAINVSGSGVAGLVYTRNGQLRAELLVRAGTEPTSLQHLIGETSVLSSLRIQNIRATGPIKGAEIGFTTGQGEFYSGDYTDDTGSVFPVKLGIVAVRRPTGWVDLVGISTIGATSGTALGFPVVDDVLDRWRWSG
jgi:hypothetical protein